MKFDLEILRVDYISVCIWLSYRTIFVLQMLQICKSAISVLLQDNFALQYNPKNLSLSSKNLDYFLKVAVASKLYMNLFANVGYTSINLRKMKYIPQIMTSGQTT